MCCFLGMGMGLLLACVNAKEAFRKTMPQGRQLNEKPSAISGCPDHSQYDLCRQVFLVCACNVAKFVGFSLLEHIHVYAHMYTCMHTFMKVNA